MFVREGKCRVRMRCQARESGEARRTYRSLERTYAQRSRQSCYSQMGDTDVGTHATDVRAHVRTDGRASERASERTNERAGGRTCMRASERASEQMTHALAGCRVSLATARGSLANQLVDTRDAVCPRVHLSRLAASPSSLRVPIATAPLCFPRSLSLSLRALFLSNSSSLSLSRAALSWVPFSNAVVSRYAPRAPCQRAPSLC